MDEVPSDSYLPTRQSLLAKLGDWEDQKSWREFFETYWKLIYRTARKAGLAADAAEDVVQDTVLTVARNIGSLDYNPKKGSFKGWLLNTVKWRIADRRRKALHHEMLLSDVAALPESRTGDPIEDVPDPAAAAKLDQIWEEEWKESLLRTVVARVKKRVSARQYQIFDLYVLREWPARKVAKTLMVGVGQVYLAKHRVGKVFATETRKLGIDGNASTGT